MPDNYSKYLETYNGKALLRKHSLDEQGTWKITGEDPNCDFGGSHHTPHIDTVEGRLQDVIHYGVNLPSFWQWGGGGDFQLLSIRKVDRDTSKEIEALIQQENNLKEQLEKVKKDLKELGVKKNALR